MNRPPRYNFPSWNYGYTLGPPDMSGSGDYTSYNYGPRYGPPMRGRGGRGMPFRGRGGKVANINKKQRDNKNVPKVDEKIEEEKKENNDSEEGEIKKSEDEEKLVDEKPKPDEQETEIQAEARPLSMILHGKNPIMFCNDQSKYRGLHMEWEQVSETGPPHDKTFTWTLRMGDMSTFGSSNSKKGAKNKAAEEMVKVLDKLPKPNKRTYHQMNQGQFFPRMPPPHWMMMRRGGMPPPYPMMPPHPRMMRMPRAPLVASQTEEGASAGEQPKVEGEEGELLAEVKPKMAKGSEQNLPKLINQSQNNPISKLYEYCKKNKLPEPLFEIIAENVLDTRKTNQGFTLKKTEFTMQCTVKGKQFVGNAMNKKQAKHNAAAAAWAEIGEGVKQSSIDSLLQSQRSAASS